MLADRVCDFDIGLIRKDGSNTADVRDGLQAAHNSEILFRFISLLRCPSAHKNFRGT